MLTCSCTNLNIYLPALCWHPKQICIRERRLGFYLPLTDLILSDNRNPLLQTTRHIKWTLRISHIFSLTLMQGTKSVEIACFGGHIVFEVDDRKSTHRRQCGCPGFSISSCFLPSNSSLSFPSWTSHCSCFLGGGQSFFCCSSWCWREAFPHLNHVCEMLLYETIQYMRTVCYTYVYVRSAKQLHFIVNHQETFVCLFTSTFWGSECCMGLSTDSSLWENICI